MDPSSSVDSVMSFTSSPLTARYLHARQQAVSAQRRVVSVKALVQSCERSERGAREAIVLIVWERTGTVTQLEREPRLHAYN